MQFIGTRWKTFSLNSLLEDVELPITTEPIVVHCIVVWYDGPGRRWYDLLDNDDNILFNLEHEQFQMIALNVRWEADNGLKLISRHSNAGAGYFSILYSNHGDV